jgi:hypothetical protein
MNIERMMKFMNSEISNPTTRDKVEHSDDVYMAKEYFELGYSQSKAELDSKDKEIEYITKQNYEITNSGIIKDINKLSGKSRLAECCHYAIKAGIKMENKLREKEKIIELMTDELYKYADTSLCNKEICEKAELKCNYCIKERFENLAKEEK